MDSFQENPNSSRILHQIKNIVKKDKTYRGFIFSQERLKYRNFNFNKKLNRLPMLFPHCHTDRPSFREKIQTEPLTFSRNIERYSNREPFVKKHIKENSCECISSEEGTIIHNNNNSKHGILTNRQTFLITETNITSNINSTISNSFYNNNSYRKNYNTISSFNHVKTNSSLLRFHHDLFQNPRYESLRFDETLIYGNKDKIYSYIENKVRDLAENKSYNNIENLDKDLYLNGNSTFHIKLNSITVTFYDNSTNELCIEYTLPLMLIPVFYCKDIESFKILLIKMISFDKSYTSIKTDENAIFKYLRSFFKMPVILSPIKHIVEIESSQNSKNSSPNKAKIKKMNTTHISKHPFTPLFQKKVSLKVGSKGFNHKHVITPSSKQLDIELQIPEQNTKTVEIYPNNKSNKPTLNDKQNEYEFIWVTPLKAYRVKIQTPSVILKENKTNISIHSYLDFEFLFFLYQRNFIDWDFYCLNYLFSYKKCRKMMDKLLSKKAYIDLVPSITPNTIIYLNKKQKIFSSNQKVSEFKFFSSEDGKNRVLVIKPPSFKITLMKFADNLNTDYQNDYNINFNISQGIKLIKSLEIINCYKLKDLLEKFVTITHNKNQSSPTVEFDYNAFDSINEDDWLEMLKGIDKFSNKGEQVDEHLIEFNENQLETVRKKASEFVDPCLIKKFVNESGKEIIKESEFVLPLFKRLIQRDLNYWPILCSNVFRFKKIDNKNSVKFSAIIRRKTFHFKTPVVTPKKNKRKTSVIV